jgi:hypothetical protein
MRRGQYYRLFLAAASDPSTVIAAAKTMSLHGSAQTEESSTKDTTGDALEYEVVGQTYDISGSALVLTPTDTLNTGGNSVNDMEGYVQNTLLYWKICLCENTNNRSPVINGVIASGTCKCTSLQLQGQNKQNAQYNYTLAGYGAIDVPSEPASSGTD